MSDDESVLPDAKSFVRDNVVWILGIVPFVMAAFQILKVSLGDATVTGYLIGNLDIVKFGLALILPILPVAGFWGCVAWLQFRSSLPEPHKRNLEWTVYPTYLLVSGLLFAMTVIAFVANVVLMFGLFLFWRWYHDRKAKKEGTFDEDNRLQMRPAILGLALAASSIFGSSTITWLPTEIISVEKQANVTARVLASDSDWTTYLDADRKVYITATETIQRRVPCSMARSISSQPMVLAIVSIFKHDENPNKPCPRN